MSLDADNGQWCDICWDNAATVIHFKTDSTRLDLCPDCEADKDHKCEDAYVVTKETV